MDRLQAVLDEIRAVRDCDASRRLCLDCWQWGVAHGEDEGVALAKVVLKTITHWVEYEQRISNAHRCA